MGLPGYIRTGIEHTIEFQQNVIVALASNFGECPSMRASVATIKDLTLIDSTKLLSERTKHFTNLSSAVFESDYSNELWMTSALRFFIIEDFMNALNIHELLHIEADNMVYGPLHTLLPVLREHYPLAATPLTANRGFITASVFWISSQQRLRHFTDLLTNISSDKVLLDTMRDNNQTITAEFISNNHWKQYLTWLRRFACCKPGGLEPDEQNRGVKPFAVNEMSMLAYYQYLFPDALKNLPVAPVMPANYKQRRPFCNLRDFATNGSQVGFATQNGIWDANSYGQWLGGTAKKKGRDKGFIDPSHISGQAIGVGGCRPTKSYCVRYNSTLCLSVPGVSCDEGNTTFPLWNLHVHAKHTIDFYSRPCLCNEVQVIR